MKTEPKKTKKKLKKKNSDNPRKKCGVSSSLWR